MCVLFLYNIAHGKDIQNTTKDGLLYSEKRASKSPGTSGYSRLYIGSAAKVFIGFDVQEWPLLNEGVPFLPFPCSYPVLVILKVNMKITDLDKI